jgi:hypothetical protein
MQKNFEGQQQFYCDLLGVRRECLTTSGKKDDEYRDSLVLSASKVFKVSEDLVLEDMKGISKDWKTEKKIDELLDAMYIVFMEYVDISGQLPNVESIGEFMYKCKTGSYILANEFHHLAYINGTWYDYKDWFNNTNAILVSKPTKILVSIYDTRFETQIANAIFRMKGKFRGYQHFKQLIFDFNQLTDSRYFLMLQ